jgi:hypothetical protein
LTTSLEGVEQRHWPERPDKPHCTIHLDHRKPSAARGDRVAIPGVPLLADPQRVQLGLKRRPVDHGPDSGIVDPNFRLATTVTLHVYPYLGM